jgi:hypothetical protein
MAQDFVYLVAVMDWFSRYVLRWRSSLNLELDFCIGTEGRPAAGPARGYQE